MICISCHAVTSGRLCRECVSTLRPAPERILSGGIRLIAPFEHDGAAKVLVHHLKYRGVLGFAELTAELLETRVPRLPLVPVPRVLSRRLKYGVDPARVIADALARRLAVPVVHALASHIHAPRRAGRDHSQPVQSFRLRQQPPTELVIVDDVVTTGATAIAAVAAIGADRVRAVVAANAVAAGH